MEATVTHVQSMKSVLTQLVDHANLTWPNKLWNLIGFTGYYHCECGATINDEGYRGVPHYVKYGVETIAVLTLWEGFEDRFVIGSHPKPGDPHHEFFRRLYRTLQSNGVRLEFGVR